MESPKSNQFDQNIALMDRKIEKYLTSLDTYVAYIDSKIRIYKISLDKFLISFDQKMKIFLNSLDQKFRTIDRAVHSVVSRFDSLTRNVKSYIKHHRLSLPLPVVLSFFTGFIIGLFVHKMLLPKR